MSEVVGISNGKIILFGEHAVVHGTPALVLGARLQLRATAKRLAQGPSTLKLLQRDRSAAGEDELSRAFSALLAVEPHPAALALTVRGELPPGVGLGFSAAAAVALARAVGQTLAAPSEERVQQRATAWEGVFHGNPSGVDVAASMHGGCLRFVRGSAPQPVEMATGLHLVVGLTGTRSSTREMVARVTSYIEQHPQDGAARLQAIQQLVDDGQALIGERKGADMYAALGELMLTNQQHLAVLGVSSPEIEKMCALAQAAGAYGSKLTGAGGGGAVIGLVAGDKGADAVIDAWTQASFQGFASHVGPDSGSVPTSN